MGGLLPVGSVCLEMLFVVGLIAFALRFGLSPVRTFALGRIAYAAANFVGNELGALMPMAGGSVATAQVMSLLLFAGVELLTVVALVVLVVSGTLFKGLVLVREDGSAVGGLPLEEGVGPEGADGQRRRAPFQDRLALFAEEYGLSARERDVAEQLLKGRGYARIQQELNIAEGTVNYHTRNVYAKCGVHTREELIDLFDGPDAR